MVYGVINASMCGIPSTKWFHRKHTSLNHPHFQTLSPDQDQINLSGHKGYHIRIRPNRHILRLWRQCMFALLRRGHGYSHDKDETKHNPPGEQVAERHNSPLPKHNRKGCTDGMTIHMFQYGNCALILYVHYGYSSKRKIQSITRPVQRGFWGGWNSIGVDS